MRTSLLLIALLTSLSPAAMAQSNIQIEAPGTSLSIDNGNVSIQAPGTNLSIGNAAPPSVNPGQLPVFNDTPPDQLYPNARPLMPTVNTPLPPAHTGNGVADYTNAELPEINLSGQNLSGVSFGNAIMTRANFAGSVLNQARFTNADLTGADFRGASLAGADLSNTILDGANLENADLTGAQLVNASLRGARIAGAKLNGANLANVDMSGAIRSFGPSTQAPAPAPRPNYVDPTTIARTLTIDPKNPKQPKAIDLTVNFDFDQATLTADGARQVAAIAEALKNPALAGNHFRIEGHTDSKGSDTYNLRLSQRRAATVQSTLVQQHAIASNILQTVGLGESSPIASNDGDLGRAQNRRVTLINLGQR